MIDWNKSAELNSCTFERLKDIFDKYPKSHKKVMAICDVCGKERELSFSKYVGMCKPCSNKTPEKRKVLSDRTKQYHIDNPNAAKERVEKVRRHYINHPEAKEDARLKLIEHWSSQDARDEMSEIKKQYHIDNPDAGKEHSKRLKNSIAMKLAIENQIGGNDIVNHHWLYDDADLSKYTIPMTRAEHTTMHNRMRSKGYEVPRINGATDDNGLWGYR